jgi:hypothetical protein
MTTISAARTSDTVASSSLGSIHKLLSVQSIVVILVSINRLSTLTLSYVAANEFLRWVDLLNMLVLPLISLIAFYLLKKQLERNGLALKSRWHMLLNVTFIVGVYLLGASYGDHEVTNYMHARFCADDTQNPLCQIVIFNDDEFSHWVFFTGFVMVNAALLLLQVLFPHPDILTIRDKVLIGINGVFIGLGIFANLAFEEIGLDLYVVALLALLAVYLWRRYGTQPLILYYTVAYVLGLAATGIVKLTSG